MGSKKQKTVMYRGTTKIPTMFDCPACCQQTVKATLDKKSMKAKVQCSSCKLDHEFEISELDEAVDVYGMLIDVFYE